MRVDFIMPEEENQGVSWRNGKWEKRPDKFLIIPKSGENAEKSIDKGQKIPYTGEKKAGEANAGMERIDRRRVWALLLAAAILAGCLAGCAQLTGDPFGNMKIASRPARQEPGEGETSAGTASSASAGKQAASSSAGGTAAQSGQKPAQTAEGIGKPETGSSAQQTAAPQTPPEAAAILEKAKALAAGYDYDAALALLRSYPDFDSCDELVRASAEFESVKSALVRWPDPTTIPHIFFHSLIVDTARAFDGDSDSGGYNQYMCTVSEFRAILQKLYDGGWVLVSMRDMAPAVKQADGTVRYEPGNILLPAGKKPIILSQDDVNYYEYMTDSDGDHFPDKKGDGFADRLVVDATGALTCEYITAEGAVLTGDYDLVPILESFIRQHPDFSYRGARAIIGVTGYQGVFGYKTHPKWKGILGDQAYGYQIKAAQAVAQSLKAHGYEIASHSFGHPAYGEISADAVRWDVQKWEDEVQPVVGDTDIFLYPFGSDIAGAEDYSGPKFDALYAAGYRYFCNVDGRDYWVQIHDGYVRQARRNIDGYRMYYNPEMLDDLFAVKDVLDPARPLPVPPI